MGTPTTAPLPSPIVLRVGVTGHRHLGTANETALRRQVSSVLENLRALVVEAAGSTGSRLVLVSPLAEGADQLVATCAVELGYQLACPFPFSREDYRQDFAPGSEALARFDALEATATSVLQLDGEREVLSGGAGGDERLSGARSYEHAGRIVLENCDVLLAIWDGSAAKGRGGTAQIVEEGLLAGIPTVVVPPDAPVEAQLLTGDPTGITRRAGLHALERCVLEIVRPEAGSRAATDAPPDASVARHMQSQRMLYGAYRSEQASVDGFSWRLARAWSRFWTLAPFGIGGSGLPRGHHSPAPICPPDTPERVGPHRPSALADHFDSHYRWTSRLADHYTRLHRASYVAYYLLGALAVALALAGGIAHLKHAHQTADCPLPLVGGDGVALGMDASVARDAHGAGNAFWTAARGLALFELLVVLLILLVAHRARRGHWRQKAVDYRALAEQLHTLRYLAPLGIGPPDTRPRPCVRVEGDSRATWSNWEFRRILRAGGLVDAHFTPGYRNAARDLLASWVFDQAAYHRRIAQLSERALCLHERGALACIYGALVACALYLVPALDGCSFLLTAAAAGFPALAAALHGIAGQAELERVAQRSRSMVRWLDGELAQGTLRALGRAGDDAAPGEHGAPTSAELQHAARAIAGQMLDEVTDRQVQPRSGACGAGSPG